MNREIKFRGIRSGNEQWAVGDLIHGIGDKLGRMYILPRVNIYPPACDSLAGYDVFSNTVCQYTGLKDINGVEVYEGDMITYSTMDGKQHKGTVKFCDVIAGFEIYRDGMRHCAFPSVMKSFKVIGNIFDD